MARLETWQTLRERLKKEFGRSDTVSEDTVELGLIDAFERERWNRYWFNEGNWQVTLSTSAIDYTEDTSSPYTGWPSEMLQPHTVEIVDPDDPSDREILIERDIQFIVQERIQNGVDTETLGNGTTDRPKYWTWHHDTLMFDHLPDKAYLLNLWGVKDLGTPGLNFVAGKWVPTDPTDDTAAIDNAYTNNWIKLGSNLLRYSAREIIFADHLYNAEKAAIASVQAEAERKRLRRRSRDKIRSDPRRAWSV